MPHRPPPAAPEDAASSAFASRAPPTCTAWVSTATPKVIAHRFRCLELARNNMSERLHRNHFTIAVIPGDGIGKEVVPEGCAVLEAAAKKHGFDLRLDTFDFASYDYYARARHDAARRLEGQIGRTTRSSSAPSAGPRRSRTTSRSGARCCSSAASSTSTSTCGRCA